MNGHTPPERPRLAQALLAVTSFLFVFDGLVVNLALPAIQRELDLADRDLQWTITAYLVPFAGLLLVSGRIGDLIGRRRMLIAGLATFAAGSACAGFAPSPGVLFAARALQGVGGAAAAPAAMALISSAFPSDPQRSRAFAVASIAGSVALSVGAVGGGVITAALGWRWVFFVGLPVAIGAALVAPFAVPESRDERAPRSLDVTGAAVATAALAALVLGINRGQTGLTLAALVLLAGFLLREWRAAEPLLRLGLFRIHTLTAAALGILASAGVFTCIIFLTSLYLQRVLGQGAAAAGVALVPVAVVTSFSGSVAARALRRVGWPVVATGGLALSGLAALVLSFAGPGASYWTAILPGLVLLSLGVSPTYVALTGAAGQDVPPGESGIAYGVFETFQRVGDTLMLAVVATAVAAAADGSAATSRALASGLQVGYRLLVPLAIAGIVAIYITISLNHAGERRRGVSCMQGEAPN
jgi:MFS family permease